MTWWARLKTLHMPLAMSFELHYPQHLHFRKAIDLNFLKNFIGYIGIVGYLTKI